MATVPKTPTGPPRGRVYRGSTEYTDRQRALLRERAEKRIWRVLYYHIKAMFEAADSGVLELRELMLPYLVVPRTNRTVGQELLASGTKHLIDGSPARMLGAGDTAR